MEETKKKEERKNNRKLRCFYRKIIKIRFLQLSRSVSRGSRTLRPKKYGFSFEMGMNYD